MTSSPSLSPPPPLLLLLLLLLLSLSLLVHTAASETLAEAVGSADSHPEVTPLKRETADILANDTCVLCPSDSYTFAVISDMHIGLRKETETRAREAVSAINGQVIARASSGSPLRFVFILGDITNNAQWEEYELSREILDELSVPYFPIFGNHDVWVYDRPTTANSWEEPFPTGDARFRDTFVDIFDKHGITHSFKSYVHPLHGHTVTYINFEMKLPSLTPTSPALVLYGLDYVSRHNATNPRDLYKGAAPTADIHKWENGTLTWVKRKLNHLSPDDVGNVVFMHHHTYTPTPYFVPDYFSMNTLDRDEVKAVMEESPLHLTQYWGALVGHMHFWDTQFSLYSTFTQWENSATMEEGADAISIISVSHGKITSARRCCGAFSVEVETWTTIAFSVVAASFQVSLFFFLFKYVDFKQENELSPELTNLVAGSADEFPENSLLTQSFLAFSTRTAAKGWRDWLLRKYGWACIVAGLCMLIGYFLPLVPLALYRPLLSVGASYFNDAMLGATAIPIALLLSFAFKIHPRVALSYIILALVWIIVLALDVLRFSIRSSWHHDQYSYTEFLGTLLLGVLTSVFAVGATISLRCRGNAPEQTLAPTFSASRFALTVFFMTIPGFSIMIGMTAVPATLFRILLPIDWAEFYIFVILLIITLCLSLASTVYSIFKALQLLHPLNAVAGTYITVTVISLAFQFIRIPDLHLPIYMILVFTIASVVLFICLGVISYADYRAKEKRTIEAHYDVL